MEGKLNPNISKIDVGARTLTEITVYPLSMADEEKIGDILGEGFVEFYEKASEMDENTNAGEQVTKIVDILRLGKKHISRLLAVASDVEPSQMEKIVNSMTNEQLVEIVETIWNNSFRSAIKNGMNLLEQITGNLHKK